jgi:hypothetical protein
MRLFGLVSAMMVSVMASGCIGFCGGADNLTEASVYVTDSEGEPVDSPQFHGDVGDTYYPSCGERDANQKCLYSVLNLTADRHEITVSAAGYDPETVEIDTTKNDSVHLAIALHRESKLQQILQIVRK